MALDIAAAMVTLRDLTMVFDKRMRTADPLYPKLALVRRSTRANEKYAMLGDFPGMREWLGERRFYEMRAANLIIENREWEQSLAIQKTDLEDDNMGLYPALLEGLADEGAYHPDELLFQTLADAESKPSFDGQYMFDTDHAWGDSGTQSNDLTYAVAAPAAVTTAEFKAAYRQACRTMLTYKNERGKPFYRPSAGRLSNLLLLVPPELRDVAYDATESTVIGNATNVVIDTPQIMVSPMLTSGVKFYLFQTGTPLKPFVFQARTPLERQTKGLQDIEFKEVKFMTRARYGMGPLAWWNAVLTTFTQA